MIKHHPPHLHTSKNLTYFGMGHSNWRKLSHVEERLLKCFWCVSKKLVFQKNWKLSSSRILVLHSSSKNRAKRALIVVWDQPRDKKLNDNFTLCYVADSHQTSFLTFTIEQSGHTENFKPKTNSWLVLAAFTKLQNDTLEKMLKTFFTYLCAKEKCRTSVEGVGFVYTKVGKIGDL